MPGALHRADPSSTLLARDSSTSPSTAVHRAFEVVDIFRSILACLHRADLARGLRVGRGWFLAILPELYRSIKYERVERISRMARARSDRSDIYAAAVLHIDARDVSIYRIMSRFDSNTLDLSSPMMVWPINKPAHVEKAVISLQEQFPALRTVVFGHDPSMAEAQSWTVSLVDTPSEATMPPSQHIIGHIEYVYTLRLDIFAPTRLICFDPPPNFTLQTRINLAPGTRYLTADPALLAAWRRVLTAETYLKDLHHTLNVHTVPLSLAEIGRLYELQAAAGHAERDRLQVVRAIAASAWDIADWSAFASIAGASLVKLNLGDERPDASVAITFADLPKLVEVVRRDLVSLRQLTFTMKGEASAERLLSKALRESSLEDGGRIEELRIGTDGPTPILLNTIRCVSAACAASAHINIGPFSSESVEEQCAYLHYLRKQPKAWKRHLAVVDFATLHIGVYDDVSRLEYDASDMPVPYGVAKSKLWLERISNLGVLAATSGTPNPQSIPLLSQLTFAAERFMAIAGSGTPDDVLHGSRAVLAAAKAFEKGGATTAEIMRECEELVTEITAFVNSLESISR